MCLLRRLQALQESHGVRGGREVGRGAEAMSTRQALRCSQLFRIRNKPPAVPHSGSPSLRSTQWSPAVSEGAHVVSVSGGARRASKSCSW